MPPGSITQVVFQANLQQILAEAIRRKSTALKDAVEKAIQSQYAPQDLVNAWIVGVDILRQTKMCLLCIADIGKLASLKLFPMALLLPACQAVRKLYDPIDEELQLRLAQTAITLVSVCDVGQPSLEEPLGFIFVLFSKTKSGIVQAACSAAITQSSHAILSQLLKDSSLLPSSSTSGSSGSSAAAVSALPSGVSQSSAIAVQLQAVSFFKDVCAISSGLNPKWLRLDGLPITMPLRLLLIDTVTTYLLEAGVVESGSPLFVQCLNEDLTTLVLGCDDALNTELFSKLSKLAMTALQQAHGIMRHTAPAIINYHTVMVQTCVQAPWKMAILLSVWRKALSNFAFLSKLLNYAPPTVESGSRQPSRQTSPMPEPFGGEGSQDWPPVTAQAATAPIIGLIIAAASALEAVLVSGSSDGTASITVPSVVSPERVNLMHNHSLTSTLGDARSLMASGDFGATLASNTSFSTIGQSDAANNVGLSATPSSAYQSTAHPAGAFVGSMLDFITLTTQSLSRMLDTQRQHQQKLQQLQQQASLTGGAAAASSASDSPTASSAGPPEQLGASQRQLVLTLGPKLLQCCRLAMTHLVGEDIIHSIIKATTHMVLCCCLTGHQALRDEFLGVLCGGVLNRKRTASVSSMPSDDCSDSRGSTPRSVSPSMVEPLAMATASTSGGVAGGIANAVNAVSRNLLGVGGGIGAGNSAAGGGGGGGSFSAVRRVTSFVGSVEDYQRKVHILGALVSIASGMGAFLSGGWGMVTRCFLAVDELLDDLSRTAQHEPAAQSALQDAKPLKEAIKDVFSASSSTFSDDTLDQILSSFVSNALSLPLSNVNKASLQFASECIAQCLRCGGSRSPPVGWSHASRFYQYVMSSPQHLGAPSMVDDVAHIFAAFITDGNQSPMHSSSSSFGFGHGGSSNNNRLRSTSNIGVHAGHHSSTTHGSAGSSISNAVKAYPISLLHDMYSATVSDAVGTYIVRDCLRLLQLYGQLVAPGVWVPFLNMIASFVTRSGEDVAFGFRCLEVIHNGYITQLDDDGITAMIACAGQFMVQRAQADKINVNLSAVQMLWSTADHLSALTTSSDAASTALHSEQHRHLLWSRLMVQLCESSLDTRHEVRHSSLKSLSSLVVSHGGHLPCESWRTYAHDVLLRIVDVLEETMDGLSTSSSSQPTTTTGAAISSPTLPRHEADTFSSPDTSMLLTAGDGLPIVAHLRLNAALLDDMRTVVVEAGSRSLRLYNTVLRQHVPRYSTVLCRFIGFVGRMNTVRLLGGAIEEVTLTGVKALHAMLLDLVPQGLSAEDIELCWSAVERIVLESMQRHAGQQPPPPPEEAKQATPNVLAAVVDAMGDVVAKAFFQRAQSTATPAVPFGAFSVHAYFHRLVGALEAVLQSEAVVTSYFFPGKVQCSVLALLEKLLPLLAENEWQAVLGICFNQFPSRMAIEHYIHHCAAPPAASPATAVTLKDVMPRGAHPNFVLKIAGLLQAVAGVAPYAVVNWMLPVAIRAVGTLLLLELAPTPTLAPASPPSKPIVGGFVISASFFEQVGASLKFFLWDVLLSGKYAAGTASADASTAVASSQAEQVKRREALCAVCSVFSSCVTLAQHSTSTSSSSGSHTGASVSLPEPAVKRMEQLTLWIGELVEYCVTHNDLQSASDLLSALVPASALAGAACQAVARRSWSILNRWSNGGGTTEAPGGVAVAAQAPPPGGGSLPFPVHHRRTPSLVQREVNLRSTLRAIARTNMAQRTSIVVEHYLGERHAGAISADTTDALTDALSSIQPPAVAAAVVPPAVAAAVVLSGTAGPVARAPSADLDALKATLPHLARLIVVEDMHVRVKVQQAMAIIFAAIL